MAHDDSAKPRRPTPPPPARAGAPPPPTPVRASLGDEKNSPPAEPPVQTTAELEVDGAPWTVRVGGMSRSGAGMAAAPILLLRFEPAGEKGGGAREAWVVGRSLGDLTPLHLEAAFRGSDAAPEDWAPKPLFPDTGSRSGKDN